MVVKFFNNYSAHHVPLRVAMILLADTCGGAGPFHRVSNAAEPIPSCRTLIPKGPRTQIVGVQGPNIIIMTIVIVIAIIMISGP